MLQSLGPGEKLGLASPSPPHALSLFILQKDHSAPTSAVRPLICLTVLAFGTGHRDAPRPPAGTPSPVQSGIHAQPQPT